MSILVNRDTRVMIYGLTGKYGMAQVTAMLHYGTKVVAGISAGKGGGEVQGIPLVDTAKEAVKLYGANTTVIYMPNPAVPNAFHEALSVGTRLIFIPTEGIPIHDFMRYRKAAIDGGCWVVGPNSLGIISPGETLVGSIAPEFTTPGPVGVISRSGTLSLETVAYMTENGCGQTTVASIGGDTVIGRNPVEYLREFNRDPATKAVVLLSEIGGMKDYEVCEYMPMMTKPVVAYVGGRAAKEGKRMGHMGAMIGGERESAKAKNAALREAGATVVDTPWNIPDVLKELKMV